MEFLGLINKELSLMVLIISKLIKISKPEDVELILGLIPYTLYLTTLLITGELQNRTVATIHLHLPFLDLKL